MWRLRVSLGKSDNLRCMTPLPDHLVNILHVKGCIHHVQGAPLNKYNRETFYGPDPVVGYTDYKFLDQIKPGTPTRTHYSGTKIFV